MHRAGPRSSVPGRLVRMSSFEGPSRCDALVRTYGMDVAELEDLLLWMCLFYRGDHATERQARFLVDPARSPDDLAIDSRPQEARASLYRRIV